MGRFGVEEYTYNAGHLNLLKKSGVLKLIFSFIFCLIIILQALAWLIVWSKDMSFTTTDTVFVAITILGCLAMLVSQIYFYRHNQTITEHVKIEGSYTTKRLKFKFSQKSSWSWGYLVLTNIITIVFVILLGIMVVNFIQNYVNWGRIILKMPLMLFLAVASLQVSANLRYESLLEKSKL